MYSCVCNDRACNSFGLDGAKEMARSCLVCNDHWGNACIVSHSPPSTVRCSLSNCLPVLKEYISLREIQLLAVGHVHTSVLNKEFLTWGWTTVFTMLLKCRGIEWWKCWCVKCSDTDSNSTEMCFEKEFARFCTSRWYDDGCYSHETVPHLLVMEMTHSLEMNRANFSVNFDMVSQ